MSEPDSRFASATQSQQQPSERQKKHRKEKRVKDKKRDAKVKIDTSKIFKEQ